jgi:DNA-binding response OmpR family regulator
LSPQKLPSYRDDHLYVDLRQQLVILDGRILHLTSMEYLLLALLVGHAGEAVPRTNLLTLTRKVDMHIQGLRRKLGAYADWYIETVVGTGYRFRPALPRP